MITKLCNSTCSSCTGYTSNDCVTCTDSNRYANVTTSTNSYLGQCKCIGNYYEESVAKSCVEICPALPV